jgi:hypothetical protein
MVGNLSTFEKDLPFQKCVVSSILDICTERSYENVVDFEWLVKDVALKLALSLRPPVRADFESRLA